VNTKTQIEVLSLIQDIMNQMQESQKAGISAASYYIDNVELNDLFKLFDSLKSTNADVRLYFIGEAFNAETIDITYRVIPGYYINISSTKQKQLKPKINLINYN
jgi:DNA mismatch repair ATPase MutS